jgi:protein involved in polysaccharide export with SLBB domain
MLRQFCRALAAILVTAGLSACSFSWFHEKPKTIGAKLARIPQGVASAISDPLPQAPITAMRQYRIVPGDDLQVILAGTETTLGVATVSAAGTATLPRKGEAKIEGMSLAEVEKLIEGKDGGGVHVRLRTPAPVIIVGAVGQPGSVPYREGLTLASALSEVGGATYKADLRKVFISPKGENEQTADFDPALPVLPGDVVRLKERYF